MKYEMIFGDEKLFDGCDGDTIAISMWCEGERVKHRHQITERYLLNTDLNKHPIIAMRRIIKEPKRWTWEDKKAGRLPDVGWLVYSEKDSKSALVIAKDHEGDIWFQCSCGVVRCTDGYVMLPIETPSEKAQREEDEFVNFVLHHSGSKINSSEELIAAKRAIKLAYKLQLSGELKAPKGGVICTR